MTVTIIAKGSIVADLDLAVRLFSAAGDDLVVSILDWRHVDLLIVSPNLPLR